MKTNHQRDFKGKKHTNKRGHGSARTSELADKHFGACIGFNFTNGNRGMAKSARGAKKFVNSRFRFHENAETKKLANEV